MNAAPENSLLRLWSGPLTQDLALHRGPAGLGKVPARLVPDATTTAVCGYCSTGCGLKIHLRNGEAVNLSADTEYPVNQGMACPKGWEALEPLGAADRGTTPLLRSSAGTRTPVDWNQAMQMFVSRFKSILREHGPESVAFLSTGQICTEEMALLGALWKLGIGAIHCDSNTRQCMATAHTAYKQSFGFDSPPFTYADFEESDVLVFVGANPCIAHPIMWQRVMRNPHAPEIVVVDPRRTETAEAATLHLALRPKSDLTLLYGIAARLIELGAIRREFLDAHTTGFDEFAEFLKPFTMGRVEAETGLPREQIERVAQIIARGRAVSFWWTMGVNQSHEATRTAQALINLALMTGNIGRPGTGANSITGQCNAMGSRIFSNITNLFGGRDFANEEHRRDVSRILNVPVELIPTQTSVAYDRIVERIEKGEIKALWVIATNASHSWIDRDAFNRTLSKLEFLVVQDLYPNTDTAERAHLYLPAAGWGEKEGTIINSERRIGLVKKVRRSPGLALSDFNIFKLVAYAWGCEGLLHEWDSPEAVFQILKRLSAGRPCDITGIRDYRHLDQMGGIQWPWTSQDAAVLGKPEKERRLFADGHFFTPDLRARFWFDAPRPVAEPTDMEYPLVLLTGRGTSAQWHTGTRSNKSGVLRKLAPKHCYVEIHPEDAAKQGIRPGTEVRIVSRRGVIQARAVIVSTVNAGSVFVPMHFEELNSLTKADFDPHSRQPSYKHCAVRLEPDQAGVLRHRVQSVTSRLTDSVRVLE